LVTRIRRAKETDIEPVARLFREVRQACLPYLPVLHSSIDDRKFFQEQVFPSCEVWVCGADAIDGFCAFREGWVDHLYIHPMRQGRGLGTALLDRAKATWPALRLWVFQRNAAAIRFYAARDFREEYRTDGSGNEENEPDALLRWTCAGK